MYHRDPLPRQVWHLWRGLTAALILMVAATGHPALCQIPDGVATWRLFTGGNYAEYLTHLDTEIGGKTPAWLQLNFAKLVAVAISLDKTKQWDTELSRRAEKYLAASPDAQRYFRATRRVLAGNLSGMSQFFEGTPPSYEGWQRQVEVLRQHGYPVAANAFMILFATGHAGIAPVSMPGATDGAISGFCALTQEQRAALQPVLEQRMSWYRRAEIANRALDLFLKPGTPPTSMPGAPRCYLNLALEIGKDLGIISLANIQRLAQAEKRAEAVEMARIFADEHPSDAALQAAVARLVWWDARERPAAEAFYRKAFNTVPAPQVRTVRAGYMEYMHWAKNGEGLDALVRGADPIFAGDALVAQERFAEAVPRYQAVLDDQRASLEKRLDAWGGLLDADPAAGLQAAPALLDKIERLDAKRRADLLPWMGWQLWTVADWVLPNSEGDVRRWRACRKVSEVPGWPKQAQAILERLLAIDAVACLRPQRGLEEFSLRYPAAVLYALAGYPAKAVEVLKRPISYQQEPPPGGWRNPPGVTPPKDADQPRTVTSPRAGVTDAMLKRLETLIDRIPQAATLLPPLRAAVDAAGAPAGGGQGAAVRGPE